MLAAGYTFAGYAEGLPSPGSPVCSAGKYARKHVPWANFTNVPAASSLPFSAFPMGNYASLPTVSFVIPNNDNNMHDGSIAQADAWLNRQLSGYANWALANNSLLIVTFDEDDNSNVGASRNQIPTVFYGAHVRPGNYAEQINHYNVLATVEQRACHRRADVRAAQDGLCRRRRPHHRHLGLSARSLFCAAWLLTSCPSA